MKRFIAMIMISLLIAAMAVPVSAATYDWTDSYSDFLADQLDEIKDGSEYTKYALYDVNDDGIPELFLQNERLQNNYKIYYFKDGGFFSDRTFTATGFFENYEGKFIVSYGNDENMSYVFYDLNKSLAASDQYFRERQGNKNADGTYDRVYYFDNKEISQDMYDELFAKNMTEIGLVFSDITEDAVDDEIYTGTAFMDIDKAPYFMGVKGRDTVTLSFADNSTKVISENGESLVYGLLMVNGQVITDIFPLNIDGLTYVPIRAIGETLNAEVLWTGALQKVTIIGDSTIEMYMNDDTAVVNGEDKTLEAAPINVAGTTYVPVRFVSENLNSDVYFVEGEGDFLPIISIESKQEGIEAIEEDEAYDKVDFLFSNVDWTAGENVFTRSFMDSNVSVGNGELVAGRYWEFPVDIRGAQKVWVDRYTGYVFSKYTSEFEFGVTPGIDNLIGAMLELYRR
ncbi:MAG: copper amine oxidase N-terminal domain-containing protein [Clostridiales bacterium]|nr:copper amine oxidase N-terminal domain-containing protein [Clostridiales bacterium]